MKFLLLALPALMVLSSCSNAPISPKADEDLMVEDTLAHEEIFGDVEEAGELGLKKLGPRKAITFDSNFVKMGYQINFDNKNNVDASDDTISIRFVAAIKNTAVKAYWHRGFAQSNGYEGVDVNGWKYKLEDNVYEDGYNVQSLKYYNSLTDGSNTIVANDGIYSGYQGFVIYTLRGIPYETYKNAYLGVYLELKEAADLDNAEKFDFAAVKVEKDTLYASKNSFVINSNTYNDKYFLKGTMHIDALHPETASDLVVLDGTPSDGNVAQKADLTFAKNDNFGVFRFKYDHFQHWGYDQFRQCIPYTQRVSGTNYCKIVTAGAYPIYVKENQIFMPAPEAAKAETTLYLKPGPWNADGARFAVYMWNGSGNTWLDMDDVDGVYWSATFNSSTYSDFKFVRLNGSTTENNWGNKWNETSDLSIDISKNVYATGTGDNNGSWYSIF